MVVQIAIQLNSEQSWKMQIETMPVKKRLDY